MSTKTSLNCNVKSLYLIFFFCIMAEKAKQYIQHEEIQFSQKLCTSGAKVFFQNKSRRKKIRLTKNKKISKKNE